METALLLELLSHLTMIGSFGGVILYVISRYAMLRRTTKQARRLYALIVALSVLFIGLNSFHMLQTWQHGHHEMTNDLTVSVGIVVLGGLLLLMMIYRVPVQPTRKNRVVLAVGAHPDDLEIACGGTLAKLHDAGHEIHGIVLTSGERGGNPNIRKSEAVRGARFLGFDSLMLLNFQDGKLGSHGVEVVGAIEERVKTIQPDLIFTHSAHDQHQDHQAVHEATLRAARFQSTILCYESPSVTPAFVPSFFVDIADYVDIKIESVREHADQQRKPYMSEERVRGNAIFRGGQAKTRYAEGFEVIRVLSSALGDI
jgi:LmbE family N-acetylglucosaminyl deacetylase